MRGESESRTLSSSVSVGADAGAAVRVTLDINRFLRSVAYASAQAGRLVIRAMMFPVSGRWTAQRHLKEASANNLAPRVFTSANLPGLKLLASQAAISQQNVQLYDELRRSEAYWRAHLGCAEYALRCVHPAHTAFASRSGVSLNTADVLRRGQAVKAFERYCLARGGRRVTRL